jgi:hypothetical protein
MRIVAIRPSFQTAPPVSAGNRLRGGWKWICGVVREERASSGSKLLKSVPDYRSFLVSRKKSAGLNCLFRAWRAEWIREMPPSTWIIGGFVDESKRATKFSLGWWN